MNFINNKIKISGWYDYDDPTDYDDPANRYEDIDTSFTVQYWISDKEGIEWPNDLVLIAGDLRGANDEFDGPNLFAPGYVDTESIKFGQNVVIDGVSYQDGEVVPEKLSRSFTPDGETKFFSSYAELLTYAESQLSHMIGKDEYPDSRSIKR